MTEAPAPAQAARAYQARGWRAIQLHGLREDGKTCTCKLGEKCRSTGKHPRLDDWSNVPPMTSAEIDEAWAGWRASHNVGLATGRDSGFFVLDVDPDKGGFESVKRLLADHGVDRFPETYVTRTGSGGVHYYFEYPSGQEVTNSPGRLKTEGYVGLDVRGTGGQVVAPPSVSDKGPYTVLRDVAVAPAPPWLLELIKPSEAKPAVRVGDVPLQVDLDPAEAERLARYTDRAVAANIARLRELSAKGWQGEPWNNTCFEVACSLLELANSPWNGYTDAITDFSENTPRDAEGFDDDAVQAIWRSAVARVGDKARALPEDQRASEVDIFSGPDVRVDPRLRQDPPVGGGGSVAPDRPDRTTTPRRSWDDLGNAMRLVDHYGQTLRWIEEQGRWAVYTDGRWELNGDGHVRACVQTMIDSLMPDLEGGQYSDTDLHPSSTDNKPVTWQGAWRKWLAAQRMSARVSAAIVEAKGRAELQAKRDDFDQHPMLLNVANGVVDLTTGSLQDWDPALLLMEQSPVRYDPAAKAPGWEAFLARVQPDVERRAYLQRILGYSLTGDISERAFFLHHGNGANGKSVMLSVMQKVLGGYYHVVDRNALLTKANGQAEHPTALAAMAGRRFLQVEETAAGKRLEEGVIKSLTGGEPITARFMGKDYFIYQPVGKVQYVTNHLPRLSDADSIWERTFLVAWSVEIPRAERDKGLGARLATTEAEGILAWCVRGTMQWLNGGLAAPEVALAELAEYRDEQDVFADFLNSRTIRVTDEVWTPVEELFVKYKQWAFENGIAKPMSKQAFSAVMKERHFKGERRAGGRGFFGIAVKADAHVRDDFFAL